MPTQNASWYARTNPSHVARPQLRGKVQTEICVVGGGLAGIATALALARKGRDVVLLERHVVGWGASGRSGGFVTPGFPISADVLVTRLGLPAARELYDLSRAAHQALRSDIDELGIACNGAEGALRCAPIGYRGSVAGYCERMCRDFDAGLEYWSARRLHDALESPRYRDGFFNPSTFAVDPLALTNGLAAASETRGVRIFESSPVTAVVSDTMNRFVTTPDGEVHAEHIVLAGGGYSGGLHKALQYSVVPIATFIIVTEPLGNLLEQAIRVPYAISDLTLATNYYRTLPGGRLMWGGRVQAWEPRPARIARLLLHDMTRFYPGLAGAKAAAAWSGWMPFLRHRMPVMGHLGSGIWIATGFGGLGMALTTLAGQLIADGIGDKDDRWRLFWRFGLPFTGGQLGRIPAQLIYWKAALAARFAVVWAPM